MSCVTNEAYLTNCVCPIMLRRIHVQYGHSKAHFIILLCLLDGYKTTFVLRSTNRRAFPLPHFPVSLTLQPAHSTLASVRSCEAKSFHTTHIYKLLLYYVILKDNTLSNQDMVFEFRSSSGKLWSWNHECAGRSTWSPWDWGQHPLVQIRYRHTHKKKNKKKLV